MAPYTAMYALYDQLEGAWVYQTLCNSLDAIPRDQERTEDAILTQTFIWAPNHPIFEVQHFHPAKTLQFLETQHELKRLQWDVRYRLGILVLPSTVPKLKILHSSWSQIVPFLSGRFVTDFVWEDTDLPETLYNFVECHTIMVEVAPRIFKLKEFTTLREISLPGHIWSLLMDREGQARISYSNTIKVLDLRRVIKSDLVSYKLPMIGTIESK